MPDREIAVLDAVIAGLAVAHASHDLTDRVALGMYEEPPTAALFVSVAPLPATKEEGDSVREWAHRCGIQVMGWAPALQTPDAKIRAAMLLRGDLLDALHGLFVRDDDAALTGITWDIQVSSIVLDGDIFGPATGSWGQVMIEVSYTLLADEGRI